MKSKKNKRLLTLVIEMDDYRNCGWLWESHMHRMPSGGLLVKSIYEGDFIGELMGDLKEQLKNEIKYE